MVSVFACGASTTLSVPAIGGYCFQDASGNNVRAVLPLILFPQYLNSRSFEPGSIRTSSPNEFGEKSCQHHNVSGTIFQSGDISIDRPYTKYGYNCLSCVSQTKDLSGNFKVFPYSTLATLSSVIEEKDATVYSKYKSGGKWFRRFGQTITWKRYRQSIYASQYIVKTETYSPVSGIIYTRGWSSQVYLYDYRDFPNKIYCAIKVTSGADYATIPTFLSACREADTQWMEWTDAVGDGFIIPYSGLSDYSASIDYTQKYLEAFCADENFSLRFWKEPFVDWGDMCEEAINDCHALDVNSIAFLRDVLCIVPEIRGLSKLLTSLVTLGKAASLFLAARYGLPLTFDDAKKVVSRVQDLRSQEFSRPVSIVRSQSKANVRPCGGFLGNAETRQWYKIYYCPVDGKLMKSIRTLLDWDIYPTLQNMWDLVPFSFVVDWFVDVESLMNKMDTNMYIPYLDVLAVTRTRKDVCYVPAKNLGVSGSGTLKVTYYNRQTSSMLDIPKLKISMPKKFNNYAELTAIIVQKKR